MKPSLIDTHAHLSFSQYDADRDAVLQRAWEAGLSAIVVVGAGDGIAGNDAALRLAESDERLCATVGIHPHDADKVESAWLERLEELAGHPKVVGIGETGLDFHYDFAKPEAQRRLFAEQVRLAHRANKPLIIHDREAHEEVWRILQEEGLPPAGVLFHCFSGDLEFARRVTQAGCLLSIPGVVTFAKARDLQEVAAEAELEKLVLETDCPFLAPVPHRGRRNEPAYVAEVAAAIARLRGLATEDVARVTSLTARRFFRLPGAELEPHIAYVIRNSLYLNITNRCNQACRFCPKFTDYEVKGYYLRLTREPDVEQIFQAIGPPEGYDEVVFCGYGEPTLRLEVLKVIAARMKAKGVKRVRLNTDGLANLVYGRNIVPELAGIIDAISISLNAPDAATHAGLCPSKYGEQAYEALTVFVAEAKKAIPEVVVSVVAVPGLDLEACKRKADELGVPLRIREYMNVG